MKAGFIGLGNLGSAMVKRLIEKGVELLLWNRTIDKAHKFNVEVAKSPKEVASKRDVIFLNLFDSIAVEKVLMGEEGLLSGTCENKIIIDTTTNHPEKVLLFHEEAQRKKAMYLEAPVLGSVIPASQGALTMLVSGSRGGFEKVVPLLEMLCSKIFFLENKGEATKMKLINNLLLGTFMAALGEALVLAEFVGIDKAKAIEIFSSGAGNSMVLNAKKEKLIKEDFSPHFSSAAIYKDLDYLQDYTGKIKAPLFIGSLVKELFGRSFRKGIEKEDFSSIYNLLKTL